jgi:hypothetical protein
MDIPQAVAMAAERSQVQLYQECDLGWQFPKDVVRSLGWPEDRFKLQVIDYERMYLNDLPDR